MRRVAMSIHLQTPALSAGISEGGQGFSEWKSVRALLSSCLTSGSLPAKASGRM
jgi:hypothetical protein